MIQGYLELFGDEIDSYNSESKNYFLLKQSPKTFKKTFFSVLSTNAPLKIRFIQTNQALFVSKDIQRAATIMPKLKKFVKTRPSGDEKYTISKKINELIY